MGGTYNTEEKMSVNNLTSVRLRYFGCNPLLTRMKVIHWFPLFFIQVAWFHNLFFVQVAWFHNLGEIAPFELHD